MNKKSNISFGPGAPSLILIFVVLGMSVLGMLALMSARNDRNLSRRSAEVAEAVYSLNEAAEETRRDLELLLEQAAEEAEPEGELITYLEARLPEGVYLEDGTLTWTEEAEPRSLDCALTIENADGGVKTEWLRHKLVTELFEETEDDLWN